MYRITSRLLSILLCIIVLLMPIILVSFLSDTLEVTTKTILPPLWSSTMRGLTTEVALHRFSAAIATVHRANSLVNREISVRGKFRNEFAWNATKLCTETDNIPWRPTRPPPKKAVEWGWSRAGDDARKLRTILLQARTLGTESMVPAVLFPFLKQSTIPPSTTVPPNLSSSSTTQTSTTSTTTTTTTTSTTTVTTETSTSTTTPVPGSYVPMSCPFPNLGLDTLVIGANVMRDDWHSSAHAKVTLSFNSTMEFSFLHCPLDKLQMQTINQDLTDSQAFWPHMMPMMQWFPSNPLSVANKGGCARKIGENQIGLLMSRLIDKKVFDTNANVLPPETEGTGNENGDRTRTPTFTNPIPPAPRQRKSYTQSLTELPSHSYIATDTMGAVTVTFDRQAAIEALSLIPKLTEDTSEVPQNLIDYAKTKKNQPDRSHLNEVLSAVGGTAIGAIMWDAVYDVGLVGAGRHRGVPAIPFSDLLAHPRRDVGTHCNLQSITSSGNPMSKSSFTIDSTKSLIRDFCPVQIDRDTFVTPDTEIVANNPTDVEHFRELLSLSLDVDPSVLDAYRAPDGAQTEAAFNYFQQRFVEGLFEVEVNATEEMLYELGRKALNLTVEQAATQPRTYIASAAAQTDAWFNLRMERQRRMQDLFTGPAVDVESIEAALDGNSSSLIYVVPQQSQVSGIVGGLVAVTDIYVLDIVPRAIFDAQQSAWIKAAMGEATTRNHPSSHVNTNPLIAFEDLGERILRRSYPYRSSQYQCSVDASLGDHMLSPVDFEIEQLIEKDMIHKHESDVAKSRCIVPASFAVMRRISLIVLADDPDNILGIDIFSGPVAATVIANIVATCCAAVFIFAALDALFRPLKELGAALRNVADDQIREIKPMSLSRVAEIRAVQLSMEALVSAVTVYSRFLPSRSLLQDSTEIDPTEAASRYVAVDGSFIHAIIRQVAKWKAQLSRVPWVDDEEEEEEEMIRKSRAQLAAKADAARITGTLHTVWIKATYRSRRDPTKVRSTYDPKKHCSFRHTFVCGDDVYTAVLDEIRRRISERVGEPLQVRDVGYHALPVSMGEGGQVTSLDADLNGSRRIADTTDFMQAVERSHGRPLYLVLLKTSKVNILPWIHSLICILATIFMYRIAQDWDETPISDTPRESAKAIVAFLSIRIIYNLIVAILLLIWYTVIQPSFFAWVCMAIPEICIAIFFSAFSINGIYVVFSCLSLGKVRFNAPFHPSMTVASRFALPGHVLGDALGMIPLGYAAAFEGSQVVSGVVVVAILFSLISLLIAFFYTTIMAKIAEWFPSYRLASTMGETGDFEELDPKDPDDEKAAAMLAAAAAAAAKSPTKRSASATSGKDSTSKAATAKDDDDAASKVTMQPGTTNNSSSSSPVLSGPVKHPPMNLCEREATVVKLVLRDTPMHIEKLDGVQMAELIQGFIGLCAREAEVYGGLVLRVMGTEVTVGFNCHHIQNFHVLSAAKYFFAVHRAVDAKIKHWCPDDDPARPQLVGALVSGASLAIGYIGTAEARSVQHLGIGEMLLANLLGVSEHLGAQLLTTRQTAGQLQLQSDFSRKTFDSDKMRRQRARDRVVQTLMLSGATANGAATGNDRSTSVKSTSSETAAERTARERKTREMESFAAFFAELDDPAADTDVVLLHALRIREVDGISITLPSYHRDRFRSALDLDGVHVPSPGYERDLSVFEVTTQLTAPDLVMFNKEVENLLRGTAQTLANQPVGSGSSSGAVAGFAHYCNTHPNDVVAQRMKFVNASRNTTGRNVRFVTNLGVGFRRVELRLAQVAAIASRFAEDEDEVAEAGSGGNSPRSPQSALQAAAGKKGAAAAVASPSKLSGGSGGSDAVVQRIQNKDQYTLYFTDL